MSNTKCKITSKTSILKLRKEFYALDAAEELEWMLKYKKHIKIELHEKETWFYFKSNPCIVFCKQEPLTDKFEVIELLHKVGFAEVA